MSLLSALFSIALILRMLRSPGHLPSDIKDHVQLKLDLRSLSSHVILVVLDAKALISFCTTALQPLATLNGLMSPNDLKRSLDMATPPNYLNHNGFISGQRYHYHQ
jgi:hypothetical protein